MAGTGIESIRDVGISGVVEPIGHMAAGVVVKPDDREPALCEIRGGIGETQLFAGTDAPLDAVDNQHVEAELKGPTRSTEPCDSPADDEEVTRQCPTVE